MTANSMRHSDLFQIQNRLHRSELRLGRSINQSAHPGMNDSSNTHHTWLDRDVKRQTRQPIVAELLRSLSKRHNLGMGRRIERVDGLIEANGDDFLIPRHHRPDRHLTQVKRVSRLFEGKSHHPVRGSR